MEEIILCNRPLKSDLLASQCGIDTEKVIGLTSTNPGVLNAYTPYILSESNTGTGRNLLSQLAPPQTSRALTNLSLSLGEDNVLALSDMSAKLKEYNIGLLGASTAVYANRIGGFAGAVKEYQASLIAYREAIATGGAAKSLAKQKAYSAFQVMQKGFNHELTAVTGQIKSRRGTPLTNPTRGTNIARSSRNVARLNLVDQVQANNVIKFAKHARYLGNGLAVIDFTSRIGNIHTSYKAGENWERDLFIESSSFALSASVGIFAVNAGSAALGFLMVATPIGWVGLIIGGVAIAGIAATTSIAMNSYTKDKSGNWYDQIMKAITVL